HLEQIRVMPLGLGDAHGPHLVSVPISRGMANHDLGGSGCEDIILIGFDYLWNSLGETPVHGVKIDVQGMELQTLVGMKRTLASQRPKLVIEFHPGVDRNAILSLLGSVGYKLPAKPLAPLPMEREAMYLDDCSYEFQH